MAEFTSDRNLARPVVTRFATNYLSFKSILKHRIALCQMFASDVWATSDFAMKEDSMEVEDIILSDNTYWKSNKYCLKCVISLVKVLSLVDGDAKLVMGYIYKAMDSAKEQIEKNFKREVKESEEPGSSTFKQDPLQKIEAQPTYYSRGSAPKPAVSRPLPTNHVHYSSANKSSPFGGNFVGLAMSRVYVGNLDPGVSERELEDEFRTYGAIRSVWVARKPPGYAFIEFEDRRDAQDAIHDLDGKNGWRVELSHNSRDGGRSVRGGGCSARDRGDGGSDLKCYECGEPGHFARECSMCIGSGGLGRGRRRSRTPPRYCRSQSYGRRSLSPRDRSPRHRNVSPHRGRSYRKSPPYKRGLDDSPSYKRGRDKSPSYKHGRDESPSYKCGRAESPAYANGNSAAKDRQCSRS